MPVTFVVATHAANSLQQALERQKPATQDLESFLKRCATKETRFCGEILQTSFDKNDLSTLMPMRNGFVDTVIQAYNQHHHLVLRPDDVWMSILSQFSLYVNAHAEELRSKFVAHEGKKELEIQTSGTRYNVDFGSLAKQFTGLLHDNLVDKDLKDWVLPSFSTTTSNDTTIYAIQMMSTLKAYFSFRMSLMCGIPSVTLLGEKSDWESLLKRIAKLETFGSQPAFWAKVLTPVVSRFVEAFDGPSDLEFWSRIAHYRNMGSGPTYLSGWITAFCAWDNDGKWLHAHAAEQTIPKSPKRSIEEKSIEEESWEEGQSQLVIDGIKYPVIDSDAVASGYCEVDVKLDDNGQEFETTMVAGHLSAAAFSHAQGGELDGVKPAPGWFMFTKDTQRQNELKAEYAQLTQRMEKEPNNMKLMSRRWELEDMLPRQPST